MSSGAFNDIEMSGTTEEAGTRKAFLSWPPHPVASSNPATISPIATGTTPTSCEPSHHEIAAQGLKPPSRTGHLASAGVKIMGQSASDKASSHISFGAPTSEASTSSMVDPTMIEQATRLNALINEVSPTVTRAVFRQRWREFLFDGSNRDDHATFLLKAGLKNATKPVIDRILKEESLYKGDFIQGVTQKKAVIAAVIQRATPEQLLSNVQLNIFERALERHLVTMNSRKLVRWLARAQRLGFQADDIINDDESVVPNMPELTINIPSESTSQSLPSAPPTLKGLVPTSQPSPGGQQQQGISQSHHLEQIAVPQQSLHHQTPALVLTMTGTQEQFQVSTPASISPNIPRPSIAPSPSIPPNIPTSPIGPPSQYNTSTYNNSEAVHPIQHTSTESQNGDGALPSHINESGITCRRCNFACQSMPGYLYHTRYVCEKPNTQATAPLRFFCSNCGRGFTQRSGQQYHDNNRVCWGNDIAPASQPSTATSRPQSTVKTPTETPSITLPKTSQPSTTGPSIPATPKSAEIPAGVRVSPDLLSPAQLAKMNADLASAEARYQEQVAQAATLPDTERATKLVSLKNMVTTRKSQIRKSYGVSLRLRQRDKQAIADVNDQWHRARVRNQQHSTPQRFQEYVATPAPSQPTLSSHAYASPSVPVDQTTWVTSSSTPASIPQYSQQAQNSQSTVRREIGGRYVAAQNGNAPETTTASSSDGNVTRQPERTSLPQNSTLETEIPKPAIVVGPDGAATVNGIAYRQGISDSTPAAAHDETMQQAVSENQIEDEEMRDI